MPICLCDREVHIVEGLKDVNRDNILSIFNEHKNDIWALYNEDHKYSGLYIAYRENSENTDLIDENLFIEDNFWNNAQDMIQKQRNKIIPVCNHNMEILCFAKYEPQLEESWHKLCELKDCVDDETWKKFQVSQKHIHLIGCNDVLYYFREWMLSVGAKVSVEGEQWKYFGIEESSCKGENVVNVDLNCELLNVLHTEYRSWMKDDIVELEQLLLKSYKVSDAKKSKIMFYVSPYAYFVDSISPLIFKYLEMGKESIVVMPIADVISIGRNNIIKMIAIIKMIEASGGQCYNRQKHYQERYSVCYFCSEYSGNFLPSELRKMSNYAVALQTTALYVHMYRLKGKFEEVFSEKARNEVDFLVASDYIADWICKQDSRWEKKILRFGYPKLDKLYHIFKGEPDIPEKWKKKIEGKKVFLFTEMEESWLEDFAKEDDWVMIWRPHPLLLEKNKDKVRKISEKYCNLIIDDMVSYYAAFKVSDALISERISSIMVNYLYTGKPLCFYDIFDHQPILNFRQEAWYKSAYVVLEERDVPCFARKVSCGDIENQKLNIYRKRVVNNLDGKVCERIYDYFEDRQEDIL